MVYACKCIRPRRLEENIAFLTAGIAGGCQSPDIPAGEPNSSPLEEQQALLITEPSSGERGVGEDFLLFFYNTFFPVK